MKHTTSFMRNGLCTAALSLALSPLAAMAQSEGQSPSQSGYASGKNNAATQSQGGQQATGASAQGAATASGSKQAGSAGNTAKATPSATFVLVPVVSPLRDQWMRSGCWAKLHDNQNFGGDSLTLTGPIDMPDMIGPFGIDWKGKISSIETGANTTLTVYDNANFVDPVSTFKPGERIADVSKRMGFFDQMRSLRITCTGAAAAR